MRRDASFAKLARPRLEAVCARPRLFRRLDALAARGVAWVEGPPGSGKTTLVASWLVARRARALWYRVDEADGDVATFFHHLGAAARRATRSRPSLPRFQPDQALDQAAFSRHWFRALFAGLAGPLCLVLDDYQEAPPALHPVVRAALAELPDGMRAVLLSRTRPPEAFARLQVEGKLARLAPGELLLTAQETRAVASLRGVPDRKVADVLHARSGGWPAGVTLLLAAHRHGALGEADGDDVREVFEYFAGEVLDRADPTTRQVLLETALLPEVTATAAREVTGVQRADQILGDLARRGYFTSRHGDGVFVYHPLFRTFLVERAQQVLPPARLEEVRVAAARVAAERGAVADAVALLRGAGAHAEAVALVLARAAQLLDEGRAETLEGLVQALPPASLDAEPWLSYWLGMSFLGRDLAQARPALERALENFVVRGDARGAYLACAAILDSYVYDWTEFRPLQRWLDAFGDLRRRWPEVPGGDVAARVACSIFGALMSARPDDPEVEAWQARVGRVAAGDPARDLRARAVFALAHFAVWRGDLPAALAALREARRGAARDASFEIGWAVQTARAAATGGHGAEALALAEEALALGRATGNHWWDPGSRLVAAWGASLTRDAVKASRYLREFEQAFDPTMLAYFEQAHGLVLVRSGRVDEAREHLERSLLAAEEHAAIYPQSWDHAGLAALALRRGDAAGLEHHLGEAERLGRATRSHVVGYWCHLLRCAQAAAAAPGEAARHAGEALRERREFGPFDELWIDRGVLARACALALAAGIEVHEAREVVSRLGLDAPEDAPAAWPWPVAIRMLGAFSLERAGAVAGSVRASSRPIQLLEVLVALGGTDVPEWKLTDALWPDAEGDAAQHALETNLSRLRKLLGARDAILQRDRMLSVDTRRCWVDALALERWLAGAPAPPLPEAVSTARRLSSTYRGPFLAGDASGWAAGARERLRRRVRRLADDLDLTLRKGGKVAEAIALAGALSSSDPGLWAAPAQAAG